MSGPDPAWRWPPTVPERRVMRVILGDTCAICGSPEPLAFDHDHHSGLIRGRLCGPCNLGLGAFRDRPELLEAAVKYLRRPPAARYWPKPS